MKRRNEKKYSANISYLNNVEGWLLFWGIVLVFLLVPFWFGVWNTNSMREEYLGSAFDESENPMEIFNTNESEEKISESETNRGLHLEWINGYSKNGEIDQDRIDNYQWETQNIFSMNENDIKPQEEMQERYLDIQSDKKIFEDAVGTEVSKLTLKKCQEGYRAGENVLKEYYTSENVFQIAVLAENAYSFSSVSGTEAERQKDLAVAVSHFECFTAFEKMDPGDGRIKSKFEIALRIGKMLYHEARKLKKMDLSENKQIASHLFLYAFECFKYAVEGVGENCDNYILYLYYEGLGAFELSGYIEERSVKRKLCCGVYSRFDLVSEEKMDSLPKQKFENMNKDKFWEVKSFLKGQKK